MAFLTGRKGAVQDRRFEIEKDAITVGRRSENVIAIDDPSVSSRHLVIMREGARYRLRDLDSTNGTLVNGEPVRDALLEPRDIITVGDVAFQFDDPAWSNDAPDERVETLLARTVSIRTAPTRAPESFQSSSPFGGKRDFNRMWTGLIVLAAALAVIVSVLFITSFFRG